MFLLKTTIPLLTFKSQKFGLGPTYITIKFTKYYTHACRYDMHRGGDMVIYYEKTLGTFKKKLMISLFEYLKYFIENGKCGVCVTPYKTTIVKN